jgi:transmembrane sensor
MKKLNEIETARFLAGEMNADEEITFRKMLEENKFQKELETMEKSWNNFNDLPPREESDPQQAWNRLYHRLASDGLLDDQRGPVRSRVPGSLLRIAASVVVILALGIPAVYIGMHRQGDGDRMLENVSETGVSTVDLPDGSRVYLNQGSKISYPRDFGNGRNVELEGEAFFEVMSDPANPFNVRSGRVVVSVLGTTFNVKKVPGSRNVEVFVESGKVRVSMEGSASFITLEPGQVCSTGPKFMVPRKMTDANYLSWKTKDFKFVDVELNDVLRELEESYHVTIHTPGLSLEGQKITTTYREQSIDAILETIGIAFGLSVTKREGEYYLKND